MNRDLTSYAQLLSLVDVTQFTALETGAELPSAIRP